MTVIESLDRLRDRYIEYYEDNVGGKEDAKYSWWEREKDCQQWCGEERTYVPMSNTKTLKIMREWFKKCKQQ